MSKLFKLKQWLTLEGAAKRLSSSLEEEVSTADVLQLALDGHLKLSVNFVNHGYARRGKRVPIGESRFKIVPCLNAKKSSIEWLEKNLPEQDVTLEWLAKEGAHLIPMINQNELMPLFKGPNTKTEVFEMEDAITTLHGVYGLPMVGAERLDVLHALQMETNGPSVSLCTLDGAFVEDPKGAIYQLQERFDDELIKEDRPYDDSRNFFPAGGIPDDAVIVVQTKDISEFEASLAEDTPQKPLSKQTENNLHAVVAGLARLYTKSDCSKPYEAAETILQAFALHGIETVKKDALASYIQAGNERIDK